MKKVVVLLALTILGTQAGAGSLDGRLLNCTSNSSLFGPVKTSYQFLSGSNEVVERNGITGTAVDNYKISGNELTILHNDADENVTLDISNANAVVGFFRACVFPGVPDGNSRPTCETIADICTLK